MIAYALYLATMIITGAVVETLRVSCWTIAVLMVLCVICSPIYGFIFPPPWYKQAMRILKENG